MAYPPRQTTAAHWENYDARRGSGLEFVGLASDLSAFVFARTNHSMNTEKPKANDVPQSPIRANGRPARRGVSRNARLCVAFSTVLAANTSNAQSALDRLLSRLRPIDSSFLATNQVDLSPYSTASRDQTLTGNCVGFSTVAVIEAAFNHKYCSGGSNAFRQAGYCERFDAIMNDPDRPTNFYWTSAFREWNSDIRYFMDKQELDLSELYFFHRQFLQQAVGPGNHETSWLMSFADNQIAGTAGPLVNGFSLPEERDAPFVYPSNGYNFWGDGWNELGAYVNGPNFPQSKVDAMDLTDTPISTLIPGSPLTRPVIPSAARRNARFTVTDYYTGTFYPFPTASAKIQFLERLLYSNFEVALHGALPQHSMLLVGYDRTNRTFHFKDHYRSWTTVSYDDIVRNAGTYNVVMDVAYNPPAREEMWLGDWDLDIDGQVGHLILRRTRQPTNSHYSTTSGNYYEQTLTEMPRDKWARVGSYFWNGVSYATYGRLGSDGDDGTMDFVIDNSTPEGGPSPITQHETGFSPTGFAFRMTMMAAGPGAAYYGVGTTTWNGNEYAMIMQRRGHNELVALRHTPAAFSRASWNTSFQLHFENGSAATIHPTVPNTGAHATAWIVRDGQWSQLDGWVYQDNAIWFFGAVPMVLRYSTWEHGVVSGLDGQARPLLGVAP